MPTDKQDKQPRKEQIKVTDKRIFTPDGEIREEFRDEIHPAAPQPEPPRESAAPIPEPSSAPPPPDRPAASASAPNANPNEPPRGERRRASMQAKGENPNTPFTNFIQQLIMQGYISLGMLRSPYGDAKIDPEAARDMIEILTLLNEKTAGNLTPDEEDFLTMHLGELKLAYVQRTKKI